jgi:hypothetical protein
MTIARATIALLLVSASAADAVCIYDGAHFKSTLRDFQGRLDAITTLADEFRDSDLVIRGVVLSSGNTGYSDGDWGTAYRVRVEQAFKGQSTKVILYITPRNSGGFYLGEGGDSREYLLFLNPLQKGDWAQKDYPGAYKVNYSCGQSRQWGKVSGADRARLARLATRGNSG